MTKVFKSMDGNEAAAYVSYAFTEVAAIYPITPSSPMAALVDSWSADGKKNLFDQEVRLVEMQAESGAVAALHGSLEAGALTTTYTASQGLALMIPTMFRTAGSLYPGVMHVASRTLGSHVLSIYGDHSDVMATRQSGWAMLSSGNVQEVMNLGGIAHLAAIESSVPFMHFFDGFRTSHEIQKVEVMDYEDLRDMLNIEALERFKSNSMNPERPKQRGIVQNPDTYFQSRESINVFYNAIPGIVEKYMNKVNELKGTDYRLFNYYGADDAEYVIVGMGSVSGLVQDTVDELNANGQKTGYLQVHLYRPFSRQHFLNELPEGIKRIAVIDRTKEPGARDPLYLDVVGAFANVENAPEIYGGRYGLSSKDVDHAQIKAIFDNLMQNEVKDDFTVGIVDDVTYLSLPVDDSYVIDNPKIINCKFWGLGGDGTVGANKNSIKIIGDNTDMYVQAYFEYDAKKTGGITKSNLRFGHEPIRNSNVVKNGDFIACHNQSYMTRYDIVDEVRPGGVFLLNTNWDDAALETHLPNKVKKYIAENDVQFYTINAVALAEEIGLGRRTNTILQSAFFKLAEIIPMDEAERLMKEFAEKSYGNKGEKIVNMNFKAIESGYQNLHKVEIPASWKDLEVEEKKVDETLSDYVRNMMMPITELHGDDLPISAFKGYESGFIPLGTSKYEKRGIAVRVPRWKEENCIQCNQCSFVCPHAAIRPFLSNKEEVENAPEGFRSVPAKGFKEYEFTIQVDPLDCTGCGNCVETCPAKEKALEFHDLESQMPEQENWDYALTLSHKENPMDKFTIKGSQFEQPLLEFSGACAGCSESPYAKLLTQLFGDRMYIANATGCSQAWGCAFPIAPYTTNHLGHGPAWSNLLFENNAEFCLGMYLAVGQQRAKITMELEKILPVLKDEAAKKTIQDWIDNINEGEGTRERSDAVVETLESLDLDGEALEAKEYVLKNKEQLTKKSFWMYGGDGWAYDIGYGGLDHVLATGADVNVLVVDNELYANTGGQSSKATPKGAVVQFAAAGKKTAKKDLGLLAMSYRDIYVAKVALGANMNHLIKVIKEAEAYDGPSLIVAYSPCINHGLSKGMAFATKQQKEAVESNYWQLYHYNPELIAKGENPFIMDSKEPNKSYREFLMSEVRYASLLRRSPEEGEELLDASEEDAKQTYKRYKDLAEEK
ncbi:pyruvate-ferredoxin/flavodoxin oxidoreductase [Peptoniphilus ivorii]|uniref:pyruvate:ferredoxin (flavodoxin) oxidoreductase n=1 Tax=Aedoeadaptatus ivorii TaxID=54006 RepID=UPI0027835B48|nr:pyruvate-ferredoxin/flavodoxin oxidoreductase [Peptoniphilus ivorii]